MKIGIDLNDVVRDYSANYVKYFKMGINHSFDENEIEFSTNEMKDLLPFDSKEQWRVFTYEDYPFELYGKCPAVSSNVSRDINRWAEHDLDGENVDVMFVSPMEYGLTIQSTFSFLAKIGSRIRETYFPVDSSTIWDKCDIVITASPRILSNKPENKIAIKINKDYNKDYNCEMSFDSILDLINDEENTKKMLSLINENEE